MPIDRPPALSVGDRVRVLSDAPQGTPVFGLHPRRIGLVVVEHHGAHVFPDKNAKGASERPSIFSALRFCLPMFGTVKIIRRRSRCVLICGSLIWSVLHDHRNDVR